MDVKIFGYEGQVFFTNVLGSKRTLSSRVFSSILFMNRFVYDLDYTFNTLIPTTLVKWSE